MSAVTPAVASIRHPPRAHAPQRAGGAALGQGARLAAAATGLLLPILVVWSVRFPPQVDAPNHLARHVLESLKLRGEPLPPGYEIDYRILPNLGGDLVVPLLLFVFDPVTAWKIFDSLALLLFWLGPSLFLLQQAGHRPSAWAACLLLLPFQLSGPFFWGFMNYYSGIGLAFLVLVHLGRLSRASPPAARDLAIHATLVTGLFFWHLAAFILYGAVATFLALARAWPLRRAGQPWFGSALRLLSPVAPAVVLFAAYSLTSTAEPAPPPDWGGPVRKAVRVAGLFGGYQWASDLATACLWAASAWAFFGRSVLRPGRHWLGLSTFGLAGLYLLLPANWRETSSVDTRVLPVALVCLLGWIASSAQLRRPRLGLLLLVAATLVRSASVAQAWKAGDDRLQAAAESFESVPRGCRLLTIALVPGPAKEHPEWHFGAHAVTTRGAFVPTLFAYGDQQPLRLTKDHPGPWSVEDGVLRVDEGRAREAYDYVWLCNPEGRETRLPAAWERVYSGAGTEVWRIAATE